MDTLSPLFTVDLIQIDKFLGFNFGILKFQSSKIKVSILEYWNFNFRKLKFQSLNFQILIVVWFAQKKIISLTPEVSQATPIQWCSGTWTYWKIQSGHWSVTSRIVSTKEGTWVAWDQDLWGCVYWQHGSCIIILVTLD